MTDFNTPRLLIIDDQPTSVGLLLAYLGNSDLDILVALDGHDGLAKARGGLPDLILLDVNMPGLDGFSVCEQLKSDPRTMDVPVIFLSASNDIDDKFRLPDPGRVMAVLSGSMNGTKHERFQVARRAARPPKVELGCRVRAASGMATPHACAGLRY
ncbi:MAG: response regulator [Pseudomonadota bacterium]|nr:response regulator [Pseudomonadota bacterium]MDP2352314.1 response regulator [Pseudomonadota bacterium]